MAHSLRDALKNKAVEISHSESLELTAKVFGYENWNILSAKIDAAQPVPDRSPGTIQRSKRSSIARSAVNYFALPRVMMRTLARRLLRG
jgi:hypothetical protein